ncbi:MAG: DUF7111 family protein [Halohasta sp.]
MTDDEMGSDRGIDAEYTETDGERRLSFAHEGRTAVVAQNLDGYAMVAVRPTAEAAELERYYGFEMALDHAAELLGVDPADLPVPEAAADMGM